MTADPVELPSRRGHWLDAAACLNEDPDLFFPVGKSQWKRRDIEGAIQVCGSCDVRTRCLERALKVDAEFGIWAGTTPLERKRIRRRIALKHAKGSAPARQD